MYYAYHRVSTKEQHLDRGINEIQRFCRTHGIVLSGIYLDKQTGKDFNRPEYHKLKQVLRPGDALIVTELDRFGRDKKAILEELRDIEKNNVRLMILEIPTTLMDFSGFKDDLAQMMMETISNMLLEMYASLAQAEMQKREKRQREGIEAMKRRGEWSRYGRQRKVPPETFRNYYRLYEENELTREQVTTELGISQSTFYVYRQELLSERDEN